MLLYFCVFYLYNLLPHSRYSGSSTKYGVIMDAGSSETRIYLYYWFQSPESSGNIPQDPIVFPLTTKNSGMNQTQLNMKTPGGIHTKNPDEIDDYLKPLINYAKQYIPSEEHLQTPIYLKATAGMRLLEESKRTETIDEVALVLKNSGFKFSEHSAKVIDGEEEGVFGWISINYMSNKTIASPETYATLDMGGASTQITFEPKDHPKLDLYDLTLNGTTKSLYTKSYLGYGENQAIDRYYDTILSNVTQNTVYEPCYLKGFNKTVFKNSQAYLVGTGDFSECMKKVEKLISSENNTSCSYPEGCGINGEYQPRIPENMKIVAINGFYYTVDFYGLKNSLTLNEISIKAKDYCSNEKYPVDESGVQLDKNAFFDSQCFNTAYLLNLINHGFGIDYNRTIDFKLKINDIEATWTTGAMMYEISKQSTSEST